MPHPSQSWYRTILPLYFPRNEKEAEFATKALPLDLGDEFGEPIIAERKIRISDNPVKGNVHFKTCFVITALLCSALLQKA
jgi:hypothetical protein